MSDTPEARARRGRRVRLVLAAAALRGAAAGAIRALLDRVLAWF